MARIILYRLKQKQITKEMAFRRKFICFSLYVTAIINISLRNSFKIFLSAEWLNADKLSLNNTKTKVILFRSLIK
jgi:hypothetical protein